MEKSMELIDTIQAMQSDDYAERFRAEYNQLEIRLDKLTTMLEKWDKGELDFSPKSDRAVLNEQVQGMVQYLNALRLRAEAEGIELEQ